MKPMTKEEEIAFRSMWEEDERRAEENFYKERKKRINEFFKSYIVNPHPKQLAKLLRRTEEKELRGLLWKSDLYWWDAYLATHGDAYRWLIIVKPEEATDVELHLDREDNGLFLSTPSSSDIDIVLKHHTLLNAFDEKGNLIET